MKSGKIGSVEEISQRVGGLKEQGKIIGWIEGVWDILHIGHIEFIEFAKSQCETLVVFVASDEYAKVNKGEGRPIFKQQQRSIVLSAITDIDLICEGNNPPARWDTEEYEIYMRGVTQAITPNITIVSTKTDINPEIKIARAQKIGAKFVPFEKDPPSSSSKIIEILNFNYSHRNQPQNASQKE